MSKHVVVIASGETERRSLPHLVAHLRYKDISVDEVRIPPRGRTLNVEMAEKLVKATWYGNVVDPPDKFVVLVDVDSKAPGEVLRPLQEQLPGRLGPEISATIQYAFAQWHLEAWYFADTENLRGYLELAPGSVDTSKPDEIQNPKLHLKNLLGDRVYTSVVSEEIAKRLNAQTIAQRSPSFQGFLDAVMNGNCETEASGET